MANFSVDAVQASGYGNEISQWRPLFLDKRELASYRKSLGKHDITVVPMYTPERDQVSKALMQERLAEVKSFWERNVPGLQLRFLLKKPVQVSASYCRDPDSSWKLAEKVAPEVKYDRRGKHLAAIVNCTEAYLDGSGLASVTRGNGLIWSNGWGSGTIAHEFGHNLGFSHSNSFKCKDPEVLKPGSCIQMEYFDGPDVMGDGGSYSGIYGLWRSLLVGASVVNLSEGATVTLQRQAKGLPAKPLLLRSKLGTFFIDAERAPVLEPYDVCSSDGVALRMASEVKVPFSPKGTGFRWEKSQAVTLNKNIMGSWEYDALFLDTLPVPGTQFLAVVSSVSNTDMTIRFTKRSQQKAPAAPQADEVIPDVLGLRADKYNEAQVVSVTVPPATPGVLGYIVYSDKDGCIQRTTPGSNVEIPLSEGKQQVRLAAVSTSGSLSTVSSASVTVERLLTDVVWPDSRGELVSWALNDRYPGEFTSKFRVLEDGIVVASLGKDARSWDPWPLGDPPDGGPCRSFTLEASDSKGPLDSELVLVCGYL